MSAVIRRRRGAAGRVAATRRVLAWALALTPAGALAWGPSGQILQEIAIVSPTDTLREIAQVHPSAAQVLSDFQPGRNTAGGPTIEFGSIRYDKLPTAAMAELAIRDVRDPAALLEAMKALPAPGDGVRTNWHAAWTGAGDLDVTFETWVSDASGAAAATAFPAVTVHIASGDPAIVTGWHLAGAKELVVPPVQGPPAAAPGQVQVRVPTTLEPLSAIKAYSQAMVRQDLDTMTAMAPESLARQLGGRDQLLALWQRHLIDARAQHRWPTAEQINDVRPLPAPGMNLYIVQATRWYEDWPKPRGMSHVYLLDSPDHGRHWEVLDQCCTSLNSLHRLAPGFKDDALVADLLKEDRTEAASAAKGSTAAASRAPAPN
jgi:hypothetical protein